MIHERNKSGNWRNVRGSNGKKKKNSRRKTGRGGKGTEEQAIIGKGGVNGKREGKGEKRENMDDTKVQV